MIFVSDVYLKYTIKYKIYINTKFPGFEIRVETIMGGPTLRAEAILCVGGLDLQRTDFWSESDSFAIASPCMGSILIIELV